MHPSWRTPLSGKYGQQAGRRWEERTGRDAFGAQHAPHERRIELLGKGQVEKGAAGLVTGKDAFIARDDCGRWWKWQRMAEERSGRRAEAGRSERSNKVRNTPRRAGARHSSYRKPDPTPVRC